MGNHEDRQWGRSAAQLVDELVEGLLARNVEPCQGLVEEEDLRVAKTGSTQEQAEIIEAPVATRQPTLGSKKKPDPSKIAQIEKSIANRIRKNWMLPIYQDMWVWLDEGNEPAEFIAEKADFLKQWTITKSNAFKMFHRVKGWRKKGINPTISSSPKEP